MKGVPRALCTASLMVAGLCLFGAASAGADSGAHLGSRMLGLADMPAGWKPVTVGTGRDAKGCMAPIETTGRDVRAVVSYGLSNGPIVQETLAAGPATGTAYRAAVARAAGCRSLTVEESGATYSGHGFAIPFSPVGKESRAFAYRLVDGARPLGVDVVIFREGTYAGAVLVRDSGLPDAVQLQAFVTSAVDKLDPGGGSAP